MRRGRVFRAFEPRVDPWLTGDSWRFSLRFPRVLGKPRSDLPRLNPLIELARAVARAGQATSPRIMIGELPERNDGKLVARLAIDLLGQATRRRPIGSALELQEALKNQDAGGRSERVGLRRGVISWAQQAP